MYFNAGTCGTGVYVTGYAELQSAEFENIRFPIDVRVSPPSTITDCESARVNSFRYAKERIVYDSLGHFWGVPILLQVFEDFDYDKDLLLSALIDLEPDTEYLIEALRNSTPDIRAGVAWIIGEMPVRTGEIHTDYSLVIPALLQSLNDEDREVRVFTEASLNKISGYWHGIENRSWEEWWNDVEPMIQEIQDTRHDNVSVLIQYLDHEEYVVRSKAYNAVIGLGQPAFSALVDAIFDKSLGSDSWTLSQKGRHGRQLAATALGELGSVSISTLLQALEDEDINVRQAAARGLDIIGPEAREATPLLIKLHQDEEEEDAKRVYRNALNNYRLPYWKLHIHLR